MSDITSDVQRTIDTILRLTADDNAVSLTSACKDYLCTKIFPGGELKPGISISEIPRVLPTILKCFDYDDPVLQQEGAFFIEAIASTPNSMQHTKLVIEAGAIPLLIGNLLPSTEGYVLDQTLACLGKIAARCPRDVIENGILQPLHQCLQSKDRQVYFQAVRCLAILITDCQKKFFVFLDDKVQTTKDLVKIVESHGRNERIIENRYSLVNLLSPDFNDDGAMESLKTVFDWLLAEKPKGKKYEALFEPEERKIIKLLALKLIKNAISLYGEAAVDIIDRELFFQPVVKHIFGAITTPDIKIEAIKVIEKSVAAKPAFLLTLIDNYSIISLLSKNLSNKTEDLLAACLRALKNSIEKCQNACRRKIKDFCSLSAYKKLREHKKKEISEPSKFIYNFVNVKPAAATDENDSDVEIIEQDGADVDSRIALVERPQTRNQSRRQQKRTATDERSSTRSKRSKTSNESDDNEHSDSSVNDDDNIFDDFGDHPRIHSPLNLDTVAAPAETNQEHQSFASSDDGSVRNGSNTGHQSPPGDNGNQLQGFASRASASISDNIPIDDDLDEIQPPLPRLQSPDYQNAAAATDGTPQSNLNPRSSTSGNLSQSSSGHSSALAQSAATDHGTPSINEIQPPLQSPGLQSPDHQNAAAAADVKPPNTMNPGSESSTSGNLSRSPSHNSLTATHHETSSRHPRVKSESRSSDFHDPSSPTRLSNSPGLPEGSATDGRNRSLSQKPSRTSLQFSAGTSRNNNYFAPFRYFYPAEELISKYCEKNFGLKYNSRLHKKLCEFVKTINFQHVGITSKPSENFPTNDETGFGCISMLFTGSEENAKFIRDKINAKFAYYFSQSGNFNHDKLMEVTGEPYMLKSEHLETICRWLECRIMVYDEKWELYGDWNCKNTPLFLLEKKTIKGKAIYQVVLSVETEVIEVE